MPDLNIAGISLRGSLAEKIEKVVATLKIGGDKTSIVENKTLNIETNVTPDVLRMLVDKAEETGRLQAATETVMAARAVEALPASDSEKEPEQAVTAVRDHMPTLSVGPTLDLILGPGAGATTFHLAGNIVNGTREPASLIYLVVKGPKDEPLAWRQFVDIKATFRQPSETLQMPVPVQPKSAVYFCGQFYSDEDLHLAATETDLRLEALFAPGGYAEITFTVLGSEVAENAAKEIVAAATEKNVPAAYPIFIVPKLANTNDSK